MSEVQLIYASTASHSLAIDVLKKLVHDAAENNKQRGISGFLCTDGKYFLQCLEGPKKNVLELYQHIGRDHRHHLVDLISLDDVKGKRFPAWGMGAVLDIKRHKDILREVDQTGNFQPYELSAENALSLLLSFARLKSF